MNFLTFLGLVPTLVLQPGHPRCTSHSVTQVCFPLLVQPRASRWCWWSRTCLPTQVDMRDSNSIPGLRRTLKKGLTAHSSILAWRIPWTEEPGGLWSGLAKSRTRLRRLNMLQDSQIERLHSGFNRAFFFFFLILFLNFT